MKRVKRVVAAVLFSVMMLSLTACGSKHVCDFCGEEKSCKTKELLGQKIYVCNDCLDSMNSMFGN